MSDKHSSVEEFLGAFYFVKALDKGDNVESLVGNDCSDPICLMRPLFLHFCLWFLDSDQKYFTFDNKQNSRNSLITFCAQRIAFFELVLPKIARLFPAMNIETACRKNDKLSLTFFKEIFQHSEGIKTLVVENADTVPWALTTLRPLLKSIKSIIIDKTCSLEILEKSEVILRTETFNGALDKILTN